MTAAGPTTSIREEPYQGEIIKRYGVRAVIGKGGMGAKTLAALKEHGAVYLNAIGGAAQFYARCDRAGRRRVAARVRHARSDVAPRRSKDFPAIVTMDAHGNSLHKDIEAGVRPQAGNGSKPERRLTGKLSLLSRLRGSLGLERLNRPQAAAIISRRDPQESVMK